MTQQEGESKKKLKILLKQNLFLLTNKFWDLHKNLLKNVFNNDKNQHQN